MYTLKTLHNATLQEVFDQAARHLLTQQKRSYSDERLMCMYRGEDGLKCAAGVFIGDDEYQENMEGKWWSTIAMEYGVPTQIRFLVADLQLLHDETAVDEWSVALRSLAQSYALTMPECV